MYDDILGGTPKKKVVSPPLPPPMKVQADGAKYPKKIKSGPTMKVVHHQNLGCNKTSEDNAKEEDNAKVPDCDCEDGSCDDCEKEAEMDDELEELELDFEEDEDDLNFDDLVLECEDDACEKDECSNCAGDGSKSCASSGVTITSTKLTPKLRENDPWHIKTGYKKGKLKVIGFMKLDFNSRKEDI